MFPYSFWVRYLSTFESVRIAARVYDVDTPPEGWLLASGAGVEVHALPNYVGPYQYASRALRVHRALRDFYDYGDAVIFRAPSFLANLAAPSLWKKDYPYGVEVVADPYDVFAAGAVRSLARPYFRWSATRTLRKLCARAAASAYVTAWSLQKRYPPGAGRYTTHYSSVELGDASFAAAPREYAGGKPEYVVAVVGSLNQMHKGIDLLIDAVAECVGWGLPLVLRVIGDGKHRCELEAQAASRGVSGRVQFLGQLTAGEAVRRELDQADLFVLPSRHEGLPRVVLEAMARGLPCIGSDIGGIPELLTPAELVPCGDASALASKMKELVEDPARMTRLSRRNLKEARAYHDDVLDERRAAFYREVGRQTAARVGYAVA